MIRNRHKKKEKTSNKMISKWMGYILIALYVLFYIYIKASARYDFSWDFTHLLRLK